MAIVNITGLNVRKVLVALWENSHTQGNSQLGAYSSKLTVEDAEKEITSNGGWCDYVNGRVIKCNLPFDATSFNSNLYDRDNGVGAAQRVVDQLKKEL